MGAFRVLACAGALMLGAACAAAPARSPVAAALLPVPAQRLPGLAQLSRVAAGPAVTGVRVQGRLVLSRPHQGSWPVRLLVTRAGGVRLEATGDDGFELASDGLHVQGHQLGQPIERMRIGDLPDPDRGVWGDLPLPVLVDALLPSPLPRPRTPGSDLLAVAYVGSEAHVQRLVRGGDGWRLRRRVVIDTDRLQLLQIDRYDTDGILSARIQYRGSVPAPWPFPASIDLQTSSVRAVVEIATVRAAGALQAGDFRLGSGQTS